MIYTHSIRVRYAETGIAGTLKPVNAFNYFQNVASDHCAALGISALDLLPHNLAWVVFRYEIRIIRYPVWKETLHFRTWRYPHKNLYELRRFDVTDQDGNPMIQAKSSWILTRLDTKKPVRLNRNLPANLFENVAETIQDDLPALPAPDRADITRHFTARMHDLDFNRHVNNAVYVEWALESVPADIAGGYRPDHIIVNFIGESLYNDTIVSATQCEKPDPHPVFVHSLENATTGKEITRIKTTWRSFEEICRQTPEKST